MNKLNSIRAEACHNRSRPRREKFFFQPMLSAGRTDDQYEREADAAADQVMSDQTNQSTLSMSAVQRKCSSCEEEKLHRKQTSTDTGVEAQSMVNGVVNSAGSTLDPGTRGFMAGHLGYDFSKIKIHSDSVAAKSAQSFNALAYTSGNHIVFNEGQYNPHTEKGKGLLAHELTHVVQQNSSVVSPGRIQRKSILEEVPHLDSKKDGIYTGSVDRYEYETKADMKKPGSKIGNALRAGNAKVRFDSNNCVLEIPLSVKFVNNDTDGQTHCHSGADKARPVPKAEFEKASKRIMSLIPDSLNNWFNIHLGNPGVTGCNANNIPIKVLLTKDDSNADFEIILTENEGRSGVQFSGGGGKSELSGGRMVLCGSEKTDEDVIIHESGHMVLGAGDEYREPGKSKSRERYGEHSRMAQDGSARLLQFHERHFQFATAFMNQFFPGCDATLVSGSKEIKTEITPEVSLGVVATDQGNTLGFISLGVDLGIPLTKMRELTLTLGPQFGAMGLDTGTVGRESHISALLMGVRAGLKYRKHLGVLGGYPMSFVAGASGEAGLLRNFAEDPGGLPGSTFTPYVKGSGMIGLEIDSQFFAAIEAGRGKILPGGSNADIDFYQFGLRFGVGF